MNRVSSSAENFKTFFPMFGVSLDDTLQVLNNPDNPDDPDDPDNSDNPDNPDNPGAI